MTPGSVPSTERHSAPTSAAPVVPLTPAIRRQLLIDAATEMAAAEPFGPVMTPVVIRLAALGVDVINDPAHMVAMAVLSQSLSFGLEPSAAALAKLGAAC